MIKRNRSALRIVSAALAIAAIAVVTAPVHAATMSYIQQAGFYRPSGAEGGGGPGDTPIAGQGGLEFFDPTTPAAPPPPPDTWKGLAWGCTPFSSPPANCANGGTVGNGTTLLDQRLNPDRSSLYVESTTGTLTSVFQDITTVTHFNKVIGGNFLESVDVHEFLRLGPGNLILGGPAPRVFHIDFNETLNGTCNNQPPTGTNAPINPLGSTCDDYAIMSALDLASVFLPAGSPFGNTVPVFIDFRFNAVPGSGALVCNGVAGQQPAACGSYVGPDIIIYTAEGSTNTVTVQARIREVTIDQTTPLFVIGDVEPHALGDVVNFWGAQWWKNNQMSGFVSNGVASFKGFASNAQDFCGGVWQSRPGNSSDPPETIPDDVVIIVTDTVLKEGPNISGTIKQLVLVHHDGNYGPAPGHLGGGPVTQIICTTP